MLSCVVADKFQPPHRLPERQIENKEKIEEEDDYFEKEPTKNEVKTCYAEVLLGETPLDNDVDENDLDRGGQ